MLPLRKLELAQLGPPLSRPCPGRSLLGQGLAASVTLARVSLAWPRLTLVGILWATASHKRPRQSSEEL